MKIDLHNHTLSQNLAPKKTREIILETLHIYGLDAIAITNLHSIQDALRLEQECPGCIVPGAEYKVGGEEGSSVQIVVIGLNEQLHELLMKARRRGIAYFTGILKEKNLPYFLSHIGMGIPTEHQAAPEFLENYLNFFNAIAVLDCLSSQSNSFAMGLSYYYGLSPVGGSGSLILQGKKRAYTEAPGSENITEFFTAFLQKRIKAGIASTNSESKIGTSLWQISQDFYQKEMKRIWQSELGLSMQSTKGNVLQGILESLVSPALDTAQQVFYLQHTKALEKKLGSFQEKFIDYLKSKETKRIFSLSLEIEEKKKHWLDAIAKVHEAFL